MLDVTCFMFASMQTNTYDNWMMYIFGFMQIVDRPTQGHKFLSRHYVQPQWVFDCVNARIILPTDAYLVGMYVLE